MDERFKKLYLQEARSYLEAVNQYIFTLQKDPAHLATLEELYGTIHTLKGITKEMNFARIGHFLHAVEDLLQKIHQGKSALTEDLFALLFDASDFLEGFLDQLEQGSRGEPDPEELMSRVTGLGIESPPPQKAKNTSSVSGTEIPFYHKKIRSIRMDVEKLERFLNLIGELVINKNEILERARSYSSDNLLMESVKKLERLSHELQSEVLTLRLIPLEYVLNRFPHLVQGLSREQAKEVDLTLEGREIELDRTILDALTEPLGHLVKNAIDHGIETPEERKKAGKPPIASLKISAKRERHQCLIEISDDGRGIDTREILEKAGEEPKASASEAMEAAVRLIFKPGFSTAKTLTEVSGRGMGLAFVKQKVEALGGKITVTSRWQEGTTFHLWLPLAMAIIQSLLVEEESGRYALPLTHIAGTVEIQKKEVYEVEKEPVIDFRGEVIRLRALDHVLDPGRAAWFQEKKAEERLNVIVLKAGRPVGLVVKKLLGKRETVVKPLDRLTALVPLFSGLTVLEDGSAAFILDTVNLNS